MGVVARQSFKKSIVLVIGVLIATLSTLFIYPLNLSFYGNLQFIISAATLIAPFATLGSTSLSVKFFPEFQNGDPKARGFLGLIFLILAVCIVFFGVLSLFIQDVWMDLTKLLGWSLDIFTANAFMIFGLVIVASYVSILKGYLTNFQRIVVPAILHELLIKVLLPSLILLSVYSLATDYILKWTYVGVIGVAFILLCLYTYRLGFFHVDIDWSFVKRKRLRSMSEYSLYGALGTLGAVIAFRIDTVMVAGFTDFEKTGIFSIVLYISNIILIPSQSLSPLLGAQISKHHENGELQQIHELYKKSSQSLLIIGAGLFLGLWFCLDDIFLLTARANELSIGKMVFFYVGLAKVIDMFFGLNGHIISYGKYYRWNFIFILLMGVLTITTNLYFIPKIGFVGAAVATMISLIIFNFLKFLFVFKVYKMHPFTWATCKTLVLIGSSFLIVGSLPRGSNPLVNIILRSAVVIVVYALPIYFFKVSEDINREVDNLVKKCRVLLFEG